jgi:hypothetical protein
MLAERDPLALELFEKFSEAPMPNLKLCDEDVQALIDYLAHSTAGQL